jgi:arylsulfatase A-like enzyme
LDFLKQIGEYDETLIIVTSDHGEHFGEHGLAYHQFSLSEILINVPLLVKWPDGLGHRDSQKLISLTDFAPTMLCLAGIEPPDEMQGIDIRADRTHDAVFAEYIPYSGVQDRIKKYAGDVNDLLVGLQAIRTDKHKLVRTTEGEETLFDISSFKEKELRDSPLKRKLSESLAASLPELEIHPESDEELSDEVKSHLRDMGYI